jgi:hypothetical protein
MATKTPKTNKRSTKDTGKVKLGNAVKPFADPGKVKLGNAVRPF